MKKHKNKRNLFRFLLLFFVLAIAESAFAQLKKVQGAVMDPNGEPIIGALVSVTGTDRRIVTDIEGKFILEAASNEKVTVSYMGYVKQEVPIGDQIQLTIVMQEDQNVLGEVVVVAFGQQKKESIVSSITTINAKELKVPRLEKFVN